MLLLCINIIIHFKDFATSCSHSPYRYGKDKYRCEKYICRKRYHLFSPKPNKIKTPDKDLQNALFVTQIGLLYLFSVSF